MATGNATKTISIDPDSDVTRPLIQAAEEPALLEVNGARFRVEDEETDLFANYDPERARAAIKRMTGAWNGVDAQALIDEYRAWRGHDVDG